MGHRPQAVLPPRLADTVGSNYRTCLTSGARITYEENLELDTGPRWWSATLTPLALSDP
jgi:hypothetical protein